MNVFGQAGETITVTATPIPVERVLVFLSGTWYVFASGQSPGTALGGDLGGTPAPETNPVSPVAQYIAVTGWAQTGTQPTQFTPRSQGGC